MVKSYLRMVVNARRNHRNPKWPFSCIEDVVLQYGKAYPFRPLPSQYRTGTPKECFRNATLLSMKHDLLYVEGYAAGIIPVQHAWCVDAEGYVVDPTWVGKMEGKTYYGVPIKQTYLTRIMVERSLYGVLDNMEMHFPIITGEHPLNMWLERGSHAKFHTRRSSENCTSRCGVR